MYSSGPSSCPASSTSTSWDDRSWTAIATMGRGQPFRGGRRRSGEPRGVANSNSGSIVCALKAGGLVRRQVALHNMSHACVDRHTFVIRRLPNASAISVGSTPLLKGGSRNGCLSLRLSEAKLRVAWPIENGFRVCIAPSVFSEPLSMCAAEVRPKSISLAIKFPLQRCQQQLGRYFEQSSLSA